MQQDKLRRLISLGLLALLFIIYSITTDNFLTVSNVFNILREASVIGIIAVGVTFIIITAGIDLSTGALLGMTGMLCNNLIYNQGTPAGLIFLIAIAVGTVCGYISGSIVSRLRIPDFIATLAMSFIYASLQLVFAIRDNGAIVSKVIKDPDILILGGSINGFYLVTIVFILVAVIGQIVLKNTKFGTYLYATGANRKSADFSGIDTGRIKRIAFTITGFLCGIGALFTMGRSGSISTDIGNGMEFNVISAVVIGGCAFSGGRGDVIGSVIGAIFLATLQNGIYKFNFPPCVQSIVQGTIILLVVVFDSLYNRFMENKMIANKHLNEGGEA